MRVLPAHDKKRLFEKTQDSTPWPSIYMCGACCFIQAAQFYIYLSSMWPYMKFLDPDASERTFGYIVSMYALAQTIASPSFGYWSNRIDQVRVPLIAGFICMFLGNLFYLSAQFFPVTGISWVMCIARIVMGIGSGNSTVLRTYTNTVSTVADRSQAIACILGGFAMGTMFGAACQLIFALLGEEGFSLGFVHLNLYTAPALFSVLMNLFGITMISFFFEEKHVIHDEENNEISNKTGRASVDFIALGICILSKFSMISARGAIETITSPFSMTMFSFSAEMAVTINAAVETVAGVVAALLYVVLVVFDVSKRIVERPTTIACHLLLLVFFLSTFSYPFIGESVPPRVNGSDEGCDSDRFSWCSDLTTISPYIYYGAYIVVYGIAWSLANVALNSLYSKIIGPRKQGTLLGFFQMAGSIGSFTAPLVSSNFYTISGPRAVWAIEIGEVGFITLLWVLFFKRMVPFERRKCPQKTISP